MWYVVRLSGATVPAYLKKLFYHSLGIPLYRRRKKTSHQHQSLFSAGPVTNTETGQWLYLLQVGFQGYLRNFPWFLMLTHTSHLTLSDIDYAVFVQQKDCSYRHNSKKKG